MKKFSLKGLAAAAVTSDTNDETKDGVVKGEYNLVYFTPELLLEQNRWRRLLQTRHYVNRLRAFVVDEAHCVNKW